MKKFTRILTLGSLSSHRQSTKYACPRFHTLLAALLLMPCFAIAQNKAPTARDQNTQTAPDTGPILSFTAPAPATVSTDGTVTATLHLAGNANPSTLRVMLNNSNVTDWFSASACSHLPCDITAHLNIAAGICLGWDSLYATLEGDTGNAGIAKARFYYGNGASNSANGRAVAHAMDTPSNRASVHPAAITAGTSATLPILPPTIAISMDPSAGLTLGSTNYPACGSGTPFSFFRFDRTTMQLEDQECLTPALMPQLIQGLQALDNTSIVFLFSAAGTPLGQLNFSSVGGTDFTQSGAPTVTSYQLVGYGAASPGEAYESYQDMSTPSIHPADIQGNLVNAGASSAFYGFQPTDAPAFVAYSSPGGVSTIPFAIMLTGYPQTFPFGNTSPTNWSLPKDFTQNVLTPPGSTTSSDTGVFMVTFSPTDLSVLSQQFYETGQYISELDRLNSDLNAVTNGTIVLLSSQGSNPFGSVALGRATPSLGTFCAEVSYMGVSEHACAEAGIGGNGMLSMAGVMENPNGNGRAPATVPVHGYSKMYSSTYEAGQNDSGSLQGLFRRDHKFHLVPYQVSSFDTSTVTSTYTFDSLLSFSIPTQVGSAPAVTWPMMDTPGHQAAYAYLSNAIVGKLLFGNGTCTVDAAWCDDVRAWYAGSEVQTFAGLDLSASPAYAFPSSATGFTQSDFNDVKSQLQAEFVYLNNEMNYETWFDKVTNGALLNTGSALSSAANEVNSSLASQFATVPPPPVSLSASLLGVAGNLVGALAGPVIPEAGLVGHLLSIAAINVPLSADGSTPNPAVVQVADLITSTDGQASLAAAKYNIAVQTQLDNLFSGIRSDWFKLQTFGILTSQPSANGWYVQNTNGAVAANVAAINTVNARLSFYNQLLPQYFYTVWMDSIPVQAIVNTGLIPLADFESKWEPWYVGSNYLINYFKSDYPPPDYSAIHASSALNSTCEDYGMAASQYSYQHFNTNNDSDLLSWQNSLGDALMGATPSADGLGNLDLSQNAFYDTMLPNAVSPELKTTIFAPYTFASQPWGSNISCPTSNPVSAPAPTPGPAPAPTPVGSTTKAQTILTAVPSATRVGPQGSVTVAVSVQPTGSTVTTAPTGVINVVLGNQNLTLRRLTNGTSSVATAAVTIFGAFLPPGTYSLMVGYGGDSNFLGSTATMNLQVLVTAATTTTTLNMPPVAYQGQNLTFQTTVTSAAGTPPGTVNFQDGNTSLGSVPLDSTGNASISLSNLGLGSHSITAVYSPTDNLTYAASQSQAATLLINPVAQDMAVSLSASSVDVPDGAQSAAVKLTVSSVAAFSGQLSFACIGLPLGATCSFSPLQANLPASGAVSTNLTMSQNTTSSAGLTSVKGCVGLFGFLISALLAFRISRGRQLVGGAVWMWALIVLSVASLSGCSSGNGTSSNTTRQTGTTNIFVTATSGNITRNVPLTVNIR